MALWTRPSQAWLVEVYEPCADLDYATTIGIRSIGGRLSARFDRIHVSNNGLIPLECTIKEIRPLDVKAIRAAEKDARAKRQVEAAPDAPGGWIEREEKPPEGRVFASWTADAALSSRTNDQVAHYADQDELGDAIRQGLIRKAEGDERGATALRELRADTRREMIQRRGMRAAYGLRKPVVVARVAVVV